MSMQTPEVRQVFDTAAARYDLMNDLMSLGVHRLWKSALAGRLRALPKKRPLILDVACGTGDIGQRILAQSAGRVVGGDENMQMLARCPARRGLLRACHRAEALPFADCRFDAYTISFGMRNVGDRPAALAEAFRVLKPGGRFLCLEFASEPPVFGQLYELYSFAVIPALGRWVGGSARPWRYLVESIRRFPPREVFLAQIKAVGFARLEARALTGGIAVLYAGWRL